MVKAIAWIMLVSAALAASAASALGQCGGDCSGDDEVTVNEVVTGVNIALGSVQLSQCPPFDTSGDGVVTVDELITAVNNALNGCSGSQATPTPTATATPTMGTLVAPNLLGTFSGPGIDGFTQAVSTVRIRIEVIDGAVVVTDLNGNLFLSGSTRTVTPLTPMTLSYTSNSGDRVESLSIGPQFNGEPTGVYANITTSLPPTGVSIQFVLERES